MSADRIRALAESSIPTDYLIVLDASVTQAGRRRLVRVVIDRRPVLTAGGSAETSTPSVSLDDIAAVTRELSRLLDEHDVLGDTAYTLEVTSPGLERPVTLPHGLQRSVGRLVRVTTHDGHVHEGRIVRVTTAQLELNAGGVALSEIAKAVIQVEFGTAPSEGD